MIVGKNGAAFLCIMNILFSNLTCQEQNNSYLQTAKNAGKGALTVWALLLGSDLTHEAGHYVAAKTLMEGVKFKKLTLSLNPLSGGASIDLTATDKALYDKSAFRRLARFTTFANGPLAGMVASYMMLRFANMQATQKKFNEKTYREAWYGSKHKPLLNKDQSLAFQIAALYSGIYNFQNLLPHSTTVDGYKMLNELNKAHLFGGAKTQLAAYLLINSLRGYAGYKLYNIHTTDNE